MGNDKGAQGLAILALPALYWPGLLMWRTWGYVNETNPDWHILYKILPVAAELVALLVLVTWFYRLAPSAIASVATAGYFAFAYGFVAQNVFELDQTWTYGIALVAALIGYQLGKSFSQSEKA